MIRKFTALASVAALLIGANASAGIVVPTANLFLVPDDSSGPVGAELVFLLRGENFSLGTSGGDFSIQWNPAHLSFVSFENANPLVFDAFTADLSNVGSGQIVRADVFKSSTGTVTDFDVATLTLQVLAGLASVDSTTIQVLAAPPPFGVGWFDGNVENQYDVEYGTAQATVVPAPPAVWLLLTALGGLVARRLRRA